MKFRITLCILCGLLSISIDGKTVNLKPFISDGCTLFPNGTVENNKLWLHCCVAHDIDYWKGGTQQQRLASDKRLQACVTRLGEAEIATLMLVGVRIGGSPYIPTPYRWGYGWPYARFYNPLSSAENQLVKQYLQNVTPQLIIDELHF